PVKPAPPLAQQPEKQSTPKSNNGDPAAMKSDSEEAGQEAEPVLDCLADPWTVDETIRAELVARRKASDIPRKVFAKYEGCIAPTLEKPDQVWSLEISSEGRRMFHFIKHFGAQTSEAPSKDPFWYVLVARETGEPDQIEILDAFPSTDAEHVTSFRTGVKEMDGPGKDDQPAAVEDAPEGGIDAAEAAPSSPAKLKIVH
ncbi:MAG TPA: hypothetical protein VL588_13300, partial [Bdellovibrionota bacterium]|nr:hypothetical protein [Bdellovibrionota bacterium]